MNASIRVCVISDDQSGIRCALPGYMLNFADDITVMVHVVGHASAITPASDLNYAKR